LLVNENGIDPTRTGGDTMITYEFRSNGKDVVIKKPVGGRWYIIIDGLCVAHGIRLERDARRLSKNLIHRAREATR